MPRAPELPAGHAPAEIIPKRSPKAKIEKIAEEMGLNIKNSSIVELKADIYFKHIGLSTPKHQGIYEKLIHVLRTKIGLLKREVGWTQGGHPTKEKVVLTWLRSKSRDAPWPQKALSVDSRRMKAQSELQIPARPSGAGRSPFDTTTCPEYKGAFWASAAQLHRDIYHVSADCVHYGDVLPSRAELNSHIYTSHHAQWEEQANRAR